MKDPVMKIDDLNYYEKSLLYTRFSQFVDSLEQEVDWQSANAQEYLDKYKEDGLDEMSWEYGQYKKSLYEADSYDHVLQVVKNLI